MHYIGINELFGSSSEGHQRFLNTLSKGKDEEIINHFLSREILSNAPDLGRFYLRPQQDEAVVYFDLFNTAPEKKYGKVFPISRKVYEYLKLAYV